MDTLPIGGILGHYCVVEQIGAGAMGVVYRAHDQRLDRDVALKVLPFGVLADETVRKQFRHEALALAKINHPNIAYVYDFDSHNGIDFIVMELISGATLAEKLRGQTLTEDEVRHIGGQIARGLAKAHGVGIVHRDLKPANIAITDEKEVKILDFGLARLLPQESLDTTLTETSAHGVFAGTLAYMAPEQLGGNTGDVQTDVYSLGVVLFEMATGRRPFESDIVAELVTDIIRKPPPRPRQLKPTFSSQLQKIILKCLEKDKRHRYASALDVLTDLEQFHSERFMGARSKRIASIAVLPFENVSGDPGLEYLCDGITETIINYLSHLPRLRVVPRSTVFRYKGRHLDPLAVGHDLEVRAVVVGRIVQRSERLVIKCELIDVEQEKQMWGEQYDRTMSDVLAVEKQMSNEITNSLQLKLSGAERQTLLKHYTIKPEAYQAYIKGRYYWNKRLEGGLTKAIEYFKQAIDADPCCALAYTGLADSYNLADYYGIKSGRVAYPHAFAAASKALELDRNLAEGHTSLGFAHLFFSWDWAAAREHFLEAMRLNSNYAVAHQWFSFYLSILGKMDESIKEMERAQMLEPLSLIINTTLGWTWYFARQFDRAIEQYHNTLDLDSAFMVARHWLGLALVQIGKSQEAILELQRASELSNSYPAVLSALGYALGVSGNQTDAKRLFQRLKDVAGQRYVSPYDYALVAIGLGENDDALRFIEDAADEKCLQVVWLHIDPIFDPLRSYSRFADLLRRIGLPD